MELLDHGAGGAGAGEEWMRHRHECWPRTGNRHLLITGRTAADGQHPALSEPYLHRVLRRLGVRATQLRMDRIFDEARVTADPVRLMRLFGISATTATKYVATAHPDRVTRRRS